MGWSKTKTRPLAVGSPAPDFKVADLEGAQHSLSSLLAGGPVLLAFFKVSCPTCQFALPFLERIHQRAQPGSPRIFLVCQDDARSARDFSREFGLTMPTLVDDGRKGYAMSNAFHITHVPTLFTVEQDDRISFTTNGFSRADFQALGDRAGVAPFQPGEDVPDWRAG